MAQGLRCWWTREHEFKCFLGRSAGQRSCSAPGMTLGRPLNDPETYAIIGAALAVHAELGCGFLEAVYKAALAMEFRRRVIPFEREVTLPLFYKGEPLPPSYRVDFMCADAVVVEVNAHDGLTAIDLALAMNHLRAARLERGLLLNFGTRSLEHRRVVCQRFGPVARIERYRR